MQKLLLSCILLALLVVGFWQSRAFLSPLPVRPSLLQKLRVGASQNAVSTLLGNPAQVWSDGRTWSYYRPDGRKTVYIFFDTNMLYSGYEVDD